MSRDWVDKAKWRQLFVSELIYSCKTNTIFFSNIFFPKMNSYVKELNLKVQFYRKKCSMHTEKNTNTQLLSYACFISCVVWGLQRLLSLLFTIFLRKKIQQVKKTKSYFGLFWELRTIKLTHKLFILCGVSALMSFFVFHLNFHTGFLGVLVVVWNVLRWCCSENCTNYLARKQCVRFLRFLKCKGALEYTHGKLISLISTHWKGNARSNWIHRCEVTGSYQSAILTYMMYPKHSAWMWNPMQLAVTFPLFWGQTWTKCVWQSVLKAY